VIVPLAGGPAGGRPPPAAERPAAIDHRVHPLSASPQHHKGLAAVHRAGVLHDAEGVTEWRAAAAQLGTPATGEVAVSPMGRGTLEDVIVRRGSTRRYARDPVGDDVLRWELAVAARPVPADFAGAGRTLLEQFVAVHAAGGVAPGLYRWERGSLEQIERGTFRQQTAHLCLDQPLGGDCAFDAFHCAALGDVIERSGPRGYRSALLEAGTAMAASNSPPTRSATAPAASPFTTTRSRPSPGRKRPRCWSLRWAYPATVPVRASARPRWSGYGSSSPEPNTVESVGPASGLGATR
jgi:hypothetical protein